MELFVTGGAGFIGSNFVRHVLEHYPQARVLNYDALTYAGHPSSIADLPTRYKDRYRFVQGDIADQDQVQNLLGDDLFYAVVNFAAESHVDRSIHSSMDFIRTNIAGTQVLLDAARNSGVRRFVQVSTDEVYGSLGPEGRFSETSPLQPSSPYSASKCAADLLALAAHHTHGQDVVITRCSNNYGPFQFPEKLIPLMITRALNDEKLPVYGDGLNVRDWIHVSDHCRAVNSVLHQGRSGHIYNVGADSEMRNIDVVHMLLRELGKPESLIEFVKDRLGHDRRYAIDSAKIRQELDWKPLVHFADGLSQTIKWYRNNEAWWRPLLNT
ncbi:MAG: dTDP-glucose 4,6-dehydratase [Verrucomicrobiales bacterium]